MREHTWTHSPARAQSAPESLHGMGVHACAITTQTWMAARATSTLAPCAHSLWPDFIPQPPSPTLSPPIPSSNYLSIHRSITHRRRSYDSPKLRELSCATCACAASYRTAPFPMWSILFLHPPFSDFPIDEGPYLPAFSLLLHDLLSSHQLLCFLICCCCIAFTHVVF